MGGPVPGPDLATTVGREEDDLTWRLPEEVTQASRDTRRRRQSTSPPVCGEGRGGGGAAYLEDSEHGPGV